jgi:anti-sigma factor RsiW
MSGLLYSVRFRLDHRWAPTHMSAYVDDELGVRARVRLERHTGECPECRRVLSSLRGMLGLLKDLPRAGDDHGPDIAAAVRRRLGEH